MALLSGESSHRQSIEWRWRTAQHIASPGKPTTQTDPWIVRAREFHRYRLSQELPEELQPVASALRLRQGADPDTRVLLEAYLLARAPHERIAESMQLPTSTIEAYHALWYDIEELLQASDALMSFLFAGRQRHALSMDDRELWLKLYAVRGGVIAMECVRDYFRRRGQWKHAKEELTPEDQALRRRDEWVHLAILSECVPVTQENAAAWLFLAARMEELREPTPESILRSMSDVLTSLPSSDRQTRRHAS